MKATSTNRPAEAHAGKPAESINGLYFNYSLRLREQRVRDVDPVCGLEKITNIRWKFCIPGSGLFDPAVGEQVPINLGGAGPLEAVETTPEELLEYHYLSGRLTAWGDFYTSQSISGESFYEKQNKYKHYLALFCRYLREERPDFLCFGIFPHLGLDYVLYQAARRVKVPVVIVHQTLNPQAMLLLDTIERLGDILSLPDYPDGDVVFPMAGDKQDWWYMGGGPEPSDDRNDPSPGGFGWVSLGIRKRLRRARRLCGLRFLSTRNRIADKRGKEAFADGIRRFAKRDLPLDQPFVYFPLHLQYEATSAPQAGVFVDQLDALGRLRRMLPNKVAIIAKENPKQGHHMRDQWFFERLRSLENTHYAAPEVDTNRLIEKSVFVSTLLGTAGWEAVCRGKPVLVFGHAWYAPVAGVFSIHDNPSYDDIVNCRIDPKSVSEAGQRLSRKLIPGTTSPGYLEALPSDERAANERSIAKGICWFLTNFHQLDGVEYRGSGVHNP